MNINTENRNASNKWFSNGRQTDKLDMHELIQSMQRLLNYAENDPIGFNQLCKGNTDHVSEQLSNDITRVRKQINQ